MAKIHGGILGGLSGKVGAVVGGFHKGTAYIREHKIPSNPNSAAQQIARARMAFIMGHGRANKNAVIDTGFNFVTKGKKISAINRFIQVNLRARDPEANFGDTQYSQGNVTAPKLTTVDYKEADKKFYGDWDGNLTGYASAGDKIVLFAGDKDGKIVDVVSSLEDGLTRAELAASGGNGMYKILAAARKDKLIAEESVYLFAYAVNAAGECSPTVSAEIYYDDTPA